MRDPPRNKRPSLIEDLLLSAVRIQTFEQQRALTAATGFFFQRGRRTFVVTSRHVFLDEKTSHRPDRVEMVLHADRKDLTRSVTLHAPLYRLGRSRWVDGSDSAGLVDVAVLEVTGNEVLRMAVFWPFTPEHLLRDFAEAGVGAPLLLVGFPLGFYDTVHNLPVARQAIVASAFGVRFQGQGLFLTDARMHRGASGAPVVMRRTASAGDWALLGIHSSRLDMATRDRVADESLGLNSAWYADILLTLTAERRKASR